MDPDTPETRLAGDNFARDHWHTFLPLAHEGLGQLLVKLMMPRERAERLRSRRRVEKKRNPERKLAGVC